MGNLFSSDEELDNDDIIDKEEKQKEQTDQSSKKPEPLEKISYNELQRSVSNVTSFDNRYR